MLRSAQRIHGNSCQWASFAEMCPRHGKESSWGHGDRNFRSWTGLRKQSDLDIRRRGRWPLVSYLNHVINVNRKCFSVNQSGHQMLVCNQFVKETKWNKCRIVGHKYRFTSHDKLYLVYSPMMFIFIYISYDNNINTYQLIISKSQFSMYVFVLSSQTQNMLRQSSEQFWRGSEPSTS